MSTTDTLQMNETPAANETTSEVLPAPLASSAPPTETTTTAPTMTPTTTTPPSLEPTEDGSDQDDAIDAEEEALFRDLEQEQAEHDQQEALHPHAPPTEFTEAPLLLKKALESGEAPPPDSDEEHERNDAGGTVGDEAGGVNQASAAGAVTAASAKRAFPSRVRQLGVFVCMYVCAKRSKCEAVCRVNNRNKVRHNRHAQRGGYLWLTMMHAVITIHHGSPRYFKPLGENHETRLARKLFVAGTSFGVCVCVCVCARARQEET